MSADNGSRECDCGGEATMEEVTPVVTWEGYAMSGRLAEVCSVCGIFLGQRCSICGGRWLWEWSGPGQAIWVCEDCGETDIALHNPPRPHTWKCSICGQGYYSLGSPPSDPPVWVCAKCKSTGLVES